MLLLPIKCPFASFSTPTQGIARPSALCDLAMFNLAIEPGNRGITGPGNSHQSVGVAGLSNPGSPESESSHDGPESESPCDGPESEAESTLNGPECSGKHAKPDARVHPAPLEHGPLPALAPPMMVGIPGMFLPAFPLPCHFPTSASWSKIYSPL